MKVNWTLYLVTDSQVIKNRSLIEVVRSAIKGGVTVVQYREKNLPTRLMLEEAKALKDLCIDFGVPFIVNDRIDLALAVDAEGVHLGQDDMPPEIARKILGSSKIIGLTVHNEKELIEAQKSPIDYVSFAPVFATSTKPDHQKPLGVERLKELAEKAKIPAVAIGGINESNIEEVAKAKIEGACVVSAILGSDNPEASARRLKELWTKARQ